MNLLQADGGGTPITISVVCIRGREGEGREGEKGRGGGEGERGRGGEEG